MEGGGPSAHAAGSGGLAPQEGRGRLNSPSCTSPMKACQSGGLNERVGPVRSFESRTAIVSSTIATSTQPLVLLSVLFRHPARDRSTIPQPLPWDPRKQLSRRDRRFPYRTAGGTLCEPHGEIKHELRLERQELIIRSLEPI